MAFRAVPAYFHLSVESDSEESMSESDIFVRLWLRMSNWITFYITLLRWEFLLKWYNFLWKFFWKR